MQPEKCNRNILNIKPVTGRKLPCINGWIITLSSTIHLWNDIKETYGYAKVEALDHHTPN